MALPIRRPFITHLSLSSSPLASSITQRCFSAAVPRWSAEIQRKKSFNPQLRSASKEKSAKTQQKALQAAAMAKRKQSNVDIGLLPNTIIPPIRGPHPYHDFKRAAWFLYTTKRTQLKEWAQLVANLWYRSPKTGKRFWQRSAKLNSKAIVPTALALHEQMYTALAEGDVKALEAICCEGLLANYHARIGDRMEKGEGMEWRRVKVHGGLWGLGAEAKVLSQRFAAIDIEGWGVRQVVVRIESTQVMRRFGNGGRELAGTGEKGRRVVENLVLQETYVGYETEGWRVWGTTKETGADVVEGWEKKKME